MRCPFCNQNTPDAWQNLHVVLPDGGRTHGLSVEPPEPIASSEVTLDYMFCANNECAQLVIRVHERARIPAHAVSDPASLTRTWLARPRLTRRAIDPLVPERYRRDYQEAAAILDASPRMSAVLSRRILADLLEEYAGLEKFSLNARIESFIADTQHPSRLRENLHHLREIGDFGAHTQRNDQAEVVDVGKDEAEWTLDILDGLLDYFIVAPERDRAMREAMDEKLEAAGRRAIQPLSEDEEAT